MTRIPMASPDITPGEIRAVLEVLETPCLSIGPRVAQFEQDLARYVGTEYAVAVSSGTAALHLCMIAAGVNEGDLVITTPFSFVASANVILYERATPVFVDIDDSTLNIDPTLLSECLVDLQGSDEKARGWLPREASPGTVKAVLPVHVFGQPADMDPINTAAEAAGASVVEDACEAIGAEYDGRKAGALGDAGTFAFYPNKQMTTGEGGIIVTDNPEWDRLFRSLRNQGRDVADTWLSHSRLGYNYRLNELSAALGIVQLQRVEELLEKRARVAGWYEARLAAVDGVVLPGPTQSTSRMSWFVYVARLSDCKDRDRIINRMAEHEIPCRPYFSPIHLQPFYRDRFGFREGDFPVAERVARSTLALPFSGVMTEEQVDRVCGKLVEAMHE
jgi:perosamine synthetase